MDRARASGAGETAPVVAWDRRPASALRQIPLLAGAVISLVAVNAFNTGEDLGLVTAAGFWMALVAINAVAWMVWRAIVSAGDRRGTKLLLGAILLNGMLTLEVALLYRWLGVNASPDWRVFVYGLMTTGLIVYAKHLAGSRDRHRSPAEYTSVKTEATRPSASLDRSPPALLLRAAVTSVAELLSIHAEDHYCRLVLRDGTSRLVHSRFRDAVSGVASIDGAQIHRGAWVAAHAVRGGRRVGRRWSLELVDGTLLPISETSVALCRDRGWLNPPA